MISIREFQPDDKLQWLQLWEAYLDFYKAKLPSEVGEQTWERLLAADGDIAGFAAVDENGTMVGMVTYLFHSTTWSSLPRCYLHDLYSVPESRGQGIGRKLIEAVYKAAADYGSDQVYWLTQEFNYPGRTLYDKVADKTDFIKYAKKL